MIAAEACLRGLAARGVRICFANPGTTELAFVEALDRVPEIRPVLGVHEGVCSGAADGYGRMTHEPALVLLHHGPGLSNAGANLHNARKARTPMVVVVGDNTDEHNEREPPLASNLVRLGQALCDTFWVAESAVGLANVGPAAVEQANRVPACVVGVGAPGPMQWMETEAPGPGRPSVTPRPVSATAILRIGEELARTPHAALLLGGPVLTAEGLRAAGRIAAATGARLFCETFPARVERGNELPYLERFPYFPEAALEALAGVELLVCVGTPVPVAFFDYPETDGRLVPPGLRVHTLGEDYQDVHSALQEMANRVPSGRGASTWEAPRVASTPRPDPAGPLTPESLGAAVAAVQPQGLIVVDESATSGRPYWTLSGDCPPHTLLALTGGAIGQGIPCATGAALACPDRPVLSLQADGSALYHLQALWTQAREHLNVTTLLCNNRSYRILQVELRRAGVTAPGPAARALTSLADPAISWADLARGFGVPSVRLERAEDLARELQRSFSTPGPYLIEAMIG